MGGFRKPSFEEEIKKLDKDSEEYKTVVRRHEAVKQADNEKRLYTHKMVLRILELTQPVKDLNVSRLSDVGDNHLTEIGKAARSLYEALRKAGIKTGGYSSDKWSDF